MEITLVTPSLNQTELLACCIASVADQQGVEVEHIVQDAGTPGFQEFSAQMAVEWPNRPSYRRLMISEPDQGMYDAINRGLRRGEGEICAYLNCDEQLLPGALAKVKTLFQLQPKLEILHGGFLVVDQDGELVTAQRPVKLFVPHLMTSHLANFSCATFFRRRLLDSLSAWFPVELRACGDALWNLQRIQEGVKSKTSPEYFSVFTETRSNQGLTPPEFKGKGAPSGEGANLGQKRRGFMENRPSMAQAMGRRIFSSKDRLRNLAVRHGGEEKKTVWPNLDHWDLEKPVGSIGEFRPSGD